MRIPVIALLLLVGGAKSLAESPGLNLDIQQITLSGVSSGGYMAGQFHVAHSDWVSGVGIIAGGPYYCARNSLATALGQCVDKGDGAIDLGEIDVIVGDWQQRQLISHPRHLAGDRVWILHGTADTRVLAAVTDSLVAQYRAWVGNENVVYVNDKPFAHHVPTVASGTDCDVSEAPYIANCDYDAAGNMMDHIVPTSASEIEGEGQLLTLNQRVLAGGDVTGMADTAFLYVPHACLQGATCQVHVSFHGCNQNVEAVGDAYARLTGLNDWADAHNTVVLYPQTEKSALLPLNPQGCWDWWGYTDQHYANRRGVQIRAVASMVRNLAGD